MSGSSTGHISVGIFGARVSRELIYVPGYQKPGQQADGQVETRQAKIYIPVAVNDLRGKTSFLTLTCWGDKASALLAHYCRKGKEMHFYNAVLSTYKWAVTTKEGQPVMNADGSRLEEDRMSITVRGWLWGEDSNDMKAQDEQKAMMEVQQGLRGPNWKVMNHPDRIAWLNAEKAKVNQAYVPGSPTFGHAVVSKKALARMGGNAYGGAPMNQPAAAGMFNNGSIVSPNASTPNVNGVTYMSLKGQGMTDEQILANPMYAPLVTAHYQMSGGQPVPQPAAQPMNAGFAANQVYNNGQPVATPPITTPQPAAVPGTGAGANSFM